MRIKQIIASLCVVFVLAACQTTPDSKIKKEHIGALGGAIGGAWIGSNVGKGKGNVAAIAAGTLLGAFVGKEIGASLDRADLAYYEQTSQYALENTRSGTTSSWTNPDSGNNGTITPTRTYQSEAGDYCREFTQTIIVNGQEETGVGTACRQADGSWRIHNG